MVEVVVDGLVVELVVGEVLVVELEAVGVVWVVLVVVIVVAAGSVVAV